MFDVVADVKQYRHFIPWCRRSDILEVHGNARIGELEIGFPPLNESYRCRIITVRPSVVHSVAIGESIFNTLETTFKFAKDTDDSCVLHYDLVFEFKSRLHSQMAYLFFDKVVKTMVRAFLRRAEKVHGRPSLPHGEPQILRYTR
ncbi:Polyketide cyclase/dehydrase [Trichostrongylus colubriformis]|uniref:Polyketide cyclase/dehydrase n=1 Tax=Trichostrongylus colubriformis TaxID=6319 RepID=A0AAN8F8D7_TRICO